ncbi:MAG: hybrid sensor histidine kinase/response regulator [Desulfobacterales bacterium]|nr:hybrid sensor histidine kinase/response regulator [Desulfobacterales bacterium]
MLSKQKILMVDDAPSVLAVLKDILGTRYTVETASSGEEALIVLHNFRPDMVLLDVTMPGINGYEVCKIIRSDNSFGFIKIIMVSSGTKLKERLRGYEAGVDDYIGKPFDEEELLAKIRVFLRLKSVEDQLRDLNNTLNEQVRVRTEQLIDAEKMAAIGRYAAGIVHNLNNPLQVIMGYAQLLAMKHPEDKKIMSLRKAAAQMKKIIGTILSTSHMQSKEEKVKIDLNQVITDQIELLRSNSFFKHHIKTEMDLSSIPAYCGTYSHFSQSFGNLIKNAVDAMYEKKPRTMTITSSMENNAILISISDTGHGISREKMGRIFDPFFTTKPLTASDNRPTGTGLGLASSKEMIESYGGSVLVDSETGKGTTFTVRLPIKAET